MLDASRYTDLTEELASRAARYENVSPTPNVLTELDEARDLLANAVAMDDHETYRSALLDMAAIALCHVSAMETL